MALWITEHCRAWKETLVKYNQVPSLPWNHLLKVIMLSHKEYCLPGRGSVSSVNHEMPILPPWARCGVDREFMEKFWLCLGTWLVQRKATSFEKRGAWLACQTKEERHMWLLVSAHHDDGWILFSKAKVSDPYIKTIYLSVWKIMSKAFLHLLMTGTGEKEDGSKFCRC